MVSLPVCRTTRWNVAPLLFFLGTEIVPLPLRSTVDYSKAKAPGSDYRMIPSRADSALRRGSPRFGAPITAKNCRFEGGARVEGWFLARGTSAATRRDSDPGDVLVASGVRGRPHKREPERS